MPDAAPRPHRKRTKRYVTPAGQELQVDVALEPAVLDRLNQIRGVFLWSTCSGHADTPGRDAPPALVFLVPTRVVGHLVGGLATGALPVVVQVWPAFEPRVDLHRMKIMPTADGTSAGLEFLRTLDPNAWLADLARELEALTPARSEKGR